MSLLQPAPEWTKRAACADAEPEAVTDSIDPKRILDALLLPIKEAARVDEPTEELRTAACAAYTSLLWMLEQVLRDGTP